MASESDAQKVRCLHCREEISVSDRYAQGDHVKCGTCGTKHKVVRAGRLRLVMADVGPLRDALGQNQQLVNRLEAELARARASFGVGVNGIGIGVIYVVYQVGMKDTPLSTSLGLSAVGIAVVTGLLLEWANWSFLAKRSAIARITRELDETRSEGNRIRQQLREATRV